MEGDPDIRIGYLTGYHYEPTEISTEADALLWLVTEIRKLGIKINPLLPEEQLHGKTIGRFVGEVGRMTTAGDILIKIKFEGFDSPACDYVRDTPVGGRCSRSLPIGPNCSRQIQSCNPAGLSIGKT